LPSRPGISGTFLPKASAIFHLLLLLLLQPLVERVGLDGHTGHNGARFSEYRQAMRVGGAAVVAYTRQKFSEVDPQSVLSAFPIQVLKNELSSGFL